MGFEMSPTAEQESELNKYGAEMQAALADLVVSQAGDEAALRKAFRDALTLSGIFDNVVQDVKGNLDISAVQQVVDNLVTNHRLDPNKFSLSRLRELIKASEN